MKTDTNVQSICPCCVAARLEEFQTKNRKRIAALKIGDYVKAAFTERGATEHMWVTVTSIDGDCLHGTLASDPTDIRPLRFGSRVMILRQEIQDIQDGV